MQKHYGTFHDATTGETVTRELTPDEIENLPKDTPINSQVNNENS